MNNKDRQFGDIRYAIDAQFSGVTKNPEMRKDVLRQVRGEIVVKKKISLGLVLTLVLILATVTALAVTVLSGYFSGYAQLEDAHGVYSSEWPTSAKVELVRLMQENGMTVDQEKTKKLLREGLSEEQQETLATEIIGAYFSDTEFMDTFNIMQHELGAIDVWPYEQKALYTSLLEQYGQQKEDSPRFLLPEQGDIQEKDAIALAKQALTAQFVVTEETLNSYIFESAFMQSSQYGEQPIWLIGFHDPAAFGKAYVAIISRGGEVVSIEAPAQLPIAVNEDILSGAKMAEPQAHDATREQAILNAKGILTEVVNLPQEEADEFTASASFFYHERYGMGVEPVWMVVFSRGGEPTYKVLLGYDGSHIDWAPADKEFTNVRRIGEELGSLSDFIDQQGIWIYDWSLEKKAAFSQKWIPIAKAYKEKYPYFTGEGNTIWALTRRVFGMPSSSDISQGEALRIAQDASKQLGATDELIKRLSNQQFFFDITQADKPQWRVMLLGDDQYYVKIDARTGALIEAHEGRPAYTPDTFLSEP